MEIKNNLILCFVTAVMVAGCSGVIPQAPLVYSSKIVVGVDVNMANSTEQTPSINIGLKTIDAAYVPVAVATNNTNDDPFKPAHFSGVTSMRGQKKGETDAYSVFGSFDANTTGKKDGATLEMGRLFSTGIAAQTLAEAVKKRSTHEPLLRCYAMAATLTGTDQTNTLRSCSVLADAEKVSAENRNPLLRCYAMAATLTGTDQTNTLKSCSTLAEAEKVLADAEKTLAEAGNKNADSK